MSCGFEILMTHIAFEIWSSQREKHLRQSILIIVQFFQESLNNNGDGFPISSPCEPEGSGDELTKLRLNFGLVPYNLNT